jgi:DNA-binding transcriptional ArsR family regulator
MSSPRGPRTITDAAALSAMANPFRSRILDALSVDGPSTASALAKRTGQAVGSASHHLKVLAAAGLVEEAPELARDRRERWWRLVAPGTRWSRAEFADDPSAVTAATAAESLQLQRQFERARDWLANAEAAGDWDTAAFTTQYWLTLSPPELAELSQQLMALLNQWRYRAIPDDGAEREPVLFFARGFPAQP